MGEWAQGTFGCFGDIKACCLGYITAPCTIGSMIAHVYGEECGFKHCCIGMFIPFLALVRYEIRLKEGIAGDSCSDCIHVTFLMPCGFCQTVKQYKNAGCQFKPIAL
ncbi:putative PLAC8 family [Monocercomonoides exilis]|uniref:putative PLAC8 family n=1 Tax=Monocercomonoides exilis TaxID=2049356 RepID=UPI00355986FE|nr:putative PLAC8 family [Monocercomonoides exilis]|eukprot:MONOS_11176.1-p1 / transcript=MONOS_11176.1 / gene=MONOS_11176 / organism=Monocercomonoides_exilis_PA203 / gene_product=unspecified product / transcript_product=unspecified product / location=Mono_scaffold00546:27361-27747(+) / protein_length=106 / sequence_SO=supercontig / SO=protein_coding / is_pseudo=false